MSDSSDDRKNAARKKAQDHFTASAQRDALVKQERDKERASLAAKTAKLKALRLAKETAEQAVRDAAPRPETKKKPRPIRRKA